MTSRETVQHDCPVALILIDVINDLQFEQGARLARYALPMARNLVLVLIRTRRVKSIARSCCARIKSVRSCTLAARDGCYTTLSIRGDHP